MWTEFIHTALMTGALVLGLFVTLWALSVAIKDSSIADIFWGFGFVVIVWFLWPVTEGVDDRRTLILTLTTLWGLRLGFYLGWRNWGKEDPRYARLRAHVESQNRSYALHTLLHIYLFQGLFMWLVSLVLVFAMISDTPPQLGLLAWIGAAMCIVGLIFETISDLQLTRFRSDAANEGKVMDQGLWRYTRHPNYFGEACVWVGFFVIAMENPYAAVTIISPLTILYALLGPTGKGLLERRMSKKRPDFEEYKRRTSGFFPLPPKP